MEAVPEGEALKAQWWWRWGWSRTSDCRVLSGQARNIVNHMYWCGAVLLLHRLLPPIIGFQWRRYCYQVPIFMYRRHCLQVTIAALHYMNSY